MYGELSFSFSSLYMESITVDTIIYMTRIPIVTFYALLFRFSLDLNSSGVSDVNLFLTACILNTKIDREIHVRISVMFIRMGMISFGKV